LKRDPNDLQIELTGKETEKGKHFSVDMSITNPRSDTVDGLKFGDPSGLSTDIVLNVDGTPASRTQGPDPALPTSIGGHQTVNVEYIFEVATVGDVVLTTAATGKAPDGSAVKGTQALSVSIGRPVTPEDKQRAAVDGLDSALSLTEDEQRKFDSSLGQAAAKVLGLHTPTSAEQTAAADVGLPPELAGLAQKVNEEKAFWEGFGTEFKSELDKQGKAGGQALANLYASIEDPNSRRQMVEQVVSNVKSLPGAALENLGYLGEALGATATSQGLKNVVDDNSKMLSNLGESLNDARIGYGEIAQQNAEKYKNDPIGYARESGKVWGGASLNGVKEASFAALGEVGVRGVIAVAPKAFEAVGLTRATALVPDGEAAAAGTADLAGNPASAAVAARIDNAEKALSTVQELDYGTVLDDASLVTKAGIRPADAQKIQAMIADAKTEFGVDLEIGARTSEPLSAGIDGVAKREFIKPKAVSALDKILGAEESLGGRASVYKPKLPSLHVLDGLEARQPGITAKLTGRYNDQLKLYKEFQDENSSLRTLVDGSSKYDKGVTALVERPGSTFPTELQKVPGQPAFAYLEQLDEPAFLQGRGISTERAAELKSQVSNFADSSVTKLQTKTVNGTTTFIEGLEGKPIISDLDLQYVRPVDGNWPPGKRGQIETFINSRMRQIDSFPNHGWSDAALDLPSDYYEAAAKFELSTAHPAYAKAAAQQLERRFQTMAKLARDKAALTADPKLQQKLLDQAAKFEGLRADVLLAKYPPGEKIVVFKAGDIRVGSGSAGR
jgi:hypothetical protein